MVNNKGTNQSAGLSKRHLRDGGGRSINSDTAKKLDKSIKPLTNRVLQVMQNTYPELQFRIIKTIKKSEINAVLNSIHPDLGVELFNKKANVRPDGGILQVQDASGNWRTLLISEVKHQGNDVKSLMEGEKPKFYGGNVIERFSKNVAELQNWMRKESYFPYIIFCQGSNLYTESQHIVGKNGFEHTFEPEAGFNRVDRMTSACFGSKVNTVYCENIVTEYEKFQRTSLFYSLLPWEPEDMYVKMEELAERSMNVLIDEGAFVG